jgi:dipeptidyl aminopeptidase/acylaminoacyl peptidase
MSEAAEVVNMRRTRSLFLAILLVSAAGSPAGASAATAASLPPAAFGTVARAQDVALSPDGRSVAWIDAGGSPARVIVFDLVNARDRQIFASAPNTKLRSLDWVDNETILFTASATHGNAFINEQWEVYRTFAGDVASGKSTMLLGEDFAHSYNTGSKLVAPRTAKPHTAILSAYDYKRSMRRMDTGSRLGDLRKDSGSGWTAVLLEVDTRSGKGTPLDYGSQLTAQWVVDTDGNSVARGEWDQKEGLYTILVKRGGGWKELYRRSDRKALYLYGVSADRASIIAVGLDADGRSKLLALPLDGSERKVLVEDATRDVASAVLDRFSRIPIGATVGATDDIVWIDEDEKKRWAKLSGAFRDHRVEPSGGSLDNQRVLARVSAHGSPAIYYLVDYTTHKASIVAEEHPALADVKLGSVRTITYQARDGTAITAYVTRPPDAGTDPLPMVVLPHREPWAHDKADFDWWAQFLASRGYVVLQPQFRGSTGFGEAFEEAGYRQWGRLMQDDVTDSVTALIEQRIADPKRICIVGASYGGYVALAGAAFTPDLYRCAVSIAGLSDLPLFITYSERIAGKEDTNTALYLRDRIGGPFDPNVIGKSPARMALAVKIPILLIHGESDTVVPFEQSEVMANALRNAHKPFKLVKLPNEDHWLSRSETRIRMLTELESFLAENLRN